MFEFLLDNENLVSILREFVLMRMILFFIVLIKRGFFGDNFVFVFCKYRFKLFVRLWFFGGRVIIVLNRFFEVVNCFVFKGWGDNVFLLLLLSILYIVSVFWVKLCL